MDTPTRKSKLQLAIVATVADAEDSIAQFIEYHFKIGFSRIYLFIDDNSDITRNIANTYENVVCYNRDEKLLALWQEHIKAAPSKKWQLLNAETMIRQELNFYIAHSQSLKDNIDWLLHIDIDELFFPNGQDLQEHFAELQINGFGGITYLNYESISTQLESSSIYLSSRHFKINFFKHKQWFFSKSQKLFIENNSWLNKKYFKYYQNGKSCIRVYGGEVFFADVHSIWSRGHRRFGKKTDPVILHFPCARYSDFTKKYNRLGNFSDDWLGHKRAGDYIDEMHLQSRDACRLKPESKIDFYIENFLFSEEKIQALIDNNMAVEIDFHLKVIAEN